MTPFNLQIIFKTQQRKFHPLKLQSSNRNFSKMLQWTDFVRKTAPWSKWAIWPRLLPNPIKFKKDHQRHSRSNRQSKPISTRSTKDCPLPIWGFLSTSRPVWEMYPCSRCCRRLTLNVPSRTQRRDQSPPSDHYMRNAFSTNFKANRASQLCSRPRILTRSFNWGKRTKVMCDSSVTLIVWSSWRMPVI